MIKTSSYFLEELVNSFFILKCRVQTWNLELLALAIRNDWWMLWIFEFFSNIYYDANFFQNCQITFLIDPSVMMVDFLARRYDTRTDAVPTLILVSSSSSTAVRGWKTKTNRRGSARSRTSCQNDPRSCTVTVFIPLI